MITAAQVKELRERTGVGMMQCKEALGASDGDMEAATTYLRIKMGNKMSQNDPTTATEGVIALAIAEGGQQGSLLKLSCQTDFVARNKVFISAAQAMAESCLKDDPTGISAFVHDESLLTELFSKMKETIRVVQSYKYVADDNQVIVGYCHSTRKLGALVRVGWQRANAEDYDAVNQIGTAIGMQIVASKPKYVSRNQVDPDDVQREENIYCAQLLAQGKNEATIAKIMPGKLGNYYQEKCLLEQPFVRDPKKTVQQFLNDSGFVLTVLGFESLSI